MCVENLKETSSIAQCQVYDTIIAQGGGGEYWHYKSNVDMPTNFIKNI